MTKPNNVWPLDQWVALNRILKAYKIAGILLGLLCMVLVALVFYLATSPPVVVVLEKNSQQELLLRRKKKDSPITEPALRDFLKEFVRLRYTWKERDPELILKNIAPFITEGLLRKISHSSESKRE